ncbi:MAG: polymer-forming cytoskeletal protein [Lachnospiraceae bacterium]|nr:polymer-forming cytoskeletal protein [Lachnospiraceae bacterium]
MSFFKDFKEDLSQAVNELMPEENTQAAEPVAPVVETADTGFNPDDLADMLKNIEEVQTEVEAPQSLSSDEAAILTQPVPTEEPVVPVAEPVAPVMEAAPVVEPVFASEPVVSEDQKVPVAPIFGEPEVIKEEPINTVKNIKAMEVGVIIKGMSVKGDITSEGSLDVQGSVTGNISIEGRLEVTGEVTGNSTAEEVFADGAKIVGDVKCNGAVKVGPSTVVRGNITATAAVIAGAVKGDIDVQGPVILDSTAIIMGNIKSKSIQINNGATIEGLCSQCYGDISPMSFFGEEKTEKAEKPATKTTKAK